jgi:hypothetical protein
MKFFVGKVSIAMFVTLMLSPFRLQLCAQEQQTNNFIVESNQAHKPTIKKQSLYDTSPQPVAEVDQSLNPTKTDEFLPEDPKIFTYLSFIPFISASKIDAVEVGSNAKASVRSNKDYGFEFKTMQLWGTYLTSELIVQLERRSYITNSGRTFAQHGGQLFNLGVGFGVTPFKRLELKIRFFYGDELYLRPPDTSSLTIDDINTFKGDIAAYFNITSLKYLSSGLGGGIKFIKSGSVDGLDVCYNSKNGYGYFGSLYLKHSVSNVTFEESVTYEYVKKDTDLVKQTHLAVYWKFGVIFLI